MSRPAQNNFAHLVAPSATALHKTLQNRLSHDGPKSTHPKIRKLLRKALAELKAENFPECCKLALQALDIDENHAQTNHILAIGLDRLGDHAKALQLYERALNLDPNDTEIYFNLAHLATRMGLYPTAEKLLRLFVEKEPARDDGINNLAICLRDQGRVEDAIELLKFSLMQKPENPLLWNTLGTFLIDQGRLPEALTFVEEAVRLQPAFSRAHHNRGFVLSNIGPMNEAIEALEHSMSLNPPLSERLETEQARALCLFHLGKIEEAFNAWEVRHNPRMRGAWSISWDYPVWKGEDVKDKSVLMVAEQGLGDEIMFAAGLNDLIDRVGDNGKVYIAVTPRLVELFKRSFPKAQVGPGADCKVQNRPVRLVPWLPKDAKIDYWSWFGSSLKYLRPGLDAFEGQKAFMIPDAGAVDGWRERLSSLGKGPFIGLSWKSLVMDLNRSRFYSAIDSWEGILKTPGVTFVNLQYGDAAADIARVADKFGVTIHHFDELDLKNDIDGNAALCAALDLVITSPNAAGAIAGSVGTETWFITTTEVWPQLGTPRMPWYPKSKAFNPKEYGDFADALGQAQSELKIRLERGAADAA